MNDNYILSKAKITKNKQQIEQISKTFEECIKLTKKTLWHEECYYAKLKNGADISDISKRVIAENTDYYTRIIIALNTLYNEINRLFVSPYKAKYQGSIETPLKNECVVIASNNESLYFKLPRLPKKTFRRFNFFEDELRNKLDNMRDTIHALSFNNKVIRVENIFRSEYDKSLIPDNDNYDFKRIIDIITDYIGGGDGGLTTSYFLESVVSDEVEEGSYIIISPSEATLLRSSSLMSDLKKFFHM